MANLRAPTQKSVGHDSHASSINDFNGQMRAQPWYQDWFRQNGLDPNHVQLSHEQRNALQQLVIQKGGVPPDAFNDMKIDPAGNLNTEHGFASQPTWLKGIEIGAPIAAATIASGGLSSVGIPGLFGSATPEIAAPAIAGSAAPAAAGAGGGVMAGVAGAGAGASKGIMGKLGSMFGGPDIGKLLTTGGLGLLEGALAPKQFQPHQALPQGTAADMLKQSNSDTQGLFDSLKSQLGPSVNYHPVTPQTPQATPMHGGLPVDLGGGASAAATMRSPSGPPPANGGTMEDMLAQLRAAGVPV